MFVVVSIMNVKRNVAKDIHPGIGACFITAFILFFFVMPMRDVWGMDHSYGIGIAIVLISGFFLVLSFLKNQKPKRK